MKRLPAVIVLLSITLLAVSCGGGGRRHAVFPNPLNPVYKIAVLPIYNDTNSVKGPVMVRKELVKRLERYHYLIKPITETDKVLRDRLGITLGKQVHLVDMELLRDELDVDALVYGYLLNFDSVTLGVYNIRKVRAAFKLVDADSGEILWSRGKGVRTTMSSKNADNLFKGEKIGTLPARIPGLQGIPGADKWKTLQDFDDVPVEAAFLIGITELLVTKVLRRHLLYETRRMLDIIVRDFPPGPGEGDAYIRPEGVTDGSKERASLLVYPIPYLGLKDKDDNFTASIDVAVTDKDNGREDAFRIIVSKRGDDMRSAYTGADGAEMAVIITKADGKEILLYPRNKQFIVMTTGLPGNEEDISRDFEGFETFEDMTVSKYAVTVTKGGDVMRRGYVWESEDFPIRGYFEDDDSETSILIEDIRFGRPSSDLFEIPEDYTETNPYGLINQD